MGGGIDCAFRVAVIVAVVVIVVMSEMGMNVIHDWRLEKNFATLLRG